MSVRLPRTRIRSWFACAVLFWLIVGATAALAQASAPRGAFPAEPPGLEDMAARLDRLRHESHWNEARAICEEGYRSFTDYEGRAFYLQQLGLVYRGQCAFGQAAVVFRRAIAGYPRSMAVSWAVFRLAETDCEQAKAQERPETHWRVQRAGTRQVLFEAKRLLRQFVRTYPSHPRATRAMQLTAECLERLGDDQAAIAQYWRIVDSHRKCPEAPACLFRIVQVEEGLQHHDKAIGAGRRYLDLYRDKDPGGTQSMIGYCYGKKGMMDQAKLEFEKAPAYYGANDGSRAQTLYLNAVYLLSLAQYDDARRYLDLILSNSSPGFGPWQDPAHYLYATTYSYVGDYQKALAVLKAMTPKSESWARGRQDEIKRIEGILKQSVTPSPLLRQLGGPPHPPELSETK